MEIREAAVIVSEWAKEKCQIRRVCFFGSRVKGTHKPESDLDIAIALIPNLDLSSGLDTWIGVSDTWREELAALLPYKLQIEWDDGDQTEMIARGLAESSFVVYEREI